MSDKSIGEELLDLLPDDIREDMFKIVKAKLIEKGEVKGIEKPKKLTRDQEAEMIKNIVDNLM
jgi:hypothetical protein